MSIPLFYVKIAIVSAILAVSVQAQLWNTTVQTTYGPVQGFQYFNTSTTEKFFNTTTNTVTAFLGIPFAADTGYENRWKPPQPRTPWNKTLEATDFGPPCPSSSEATSSEDCLSVNIWTNANSSGAGLPVLVWNQGSEETSDNTWWYGGGMAMQDVVFVSFNRRDDAFGYLAHPELNAEGLARTGYNTSGNYGVLDFLAVLQWVQDNIAQFGGDPARVTIAGQSFGSAQVYHAVNSPLFADLFVGAISQSGIRDPHDTLLAGLATSYVTMEDALFHGQNYTAFHNVSTIAELRTLSMEELLIGNGDRVNDTYIWWVTALSTNYPLVFKPVMDGYVLPMTYEEQLATGPANDVPLITGNTKDESGVYLPLENWTVDEYTYYNTLRYGNLSDEFFTLFPADDNQTEANLQWNEAARYVSRTSTWSYASQWPISASSPIYTYYWDHAPPSQDAGAFHQSEIMYALNALYANTETYPFTSTDYAIARIMNGYWINFVRTGNPNNGGAAAGLTYWASQNETARFTMELGEGWGSMSLGSGEKVDFMLDYLGHQTAY